MPRQPAGTATSADVEVACIVEDVSQRFSVALLRLRKTFVSFSKESEPPAARSSLDVSDSLPSLGESRASNTDFLSPSHQARAGLHLIRRADANGIVFANQEWVGRCQGLFSCEGLRDESSLALPPWNVRRTRLSARQSPLDLCRRKHVMLRSIFGSLAVLALFSVVVANADDAKTKQDKNKMRGTLTSVDSKASSIKVSMKDKDGKKVEKTLQLAKDAELLDSNGKAAKIDAFHSGDRVVITEKDGKVAELKKGMAQATITSVDAKKGTITVKMKDKNGKDVEKTFYLTEDAEYIDSTGAVATVDVFQSGDDVLIIEADGKIKEMKKGAKAHHSATKQAATADKTSAAK
jgi:hypothetical protein